MTNDTRISEKVAVVKVGVTEIYKMESYRPTGSPECEKKRGQCCGTLVRKVFPKLPRNVPGFFHRSSRHYREGPIMGVRRSYVHSTCEAVDQIQTDHRGGGGAFAAGVWVRGDVGIRSLPAARRFPQREARRLSRGVSVASASRDRNHNLCAGGDGGARRQHGKSRRDRGGGCAVDDSGERHHPSGNAEGRRERADARVPALGKSAGRFEDDAAAVSGNQSRRNSGN